MEEEDEDEKEEEEDDIELEIIDLDDLGEEDADDLVRDFQDEYQGQYNDEEDFAYEIIEECYELPDFAKTYFDYEKFARDLFMCDYWFDDGFVFRAA